MGGDLDDALIDWNADLEVNLFHSLKGHRPTGINRHFHMACVHQKLVTCSGKNWLTSDHLWTHLKKMYNLDTLNELDDLPFPNKTEDFSLPEEMTNPELLSAPPSPTLTDDGLAPNRPTNLNLAGVKAANSAPTPEALLSPKRKRNARQASLTTPSQPSSPASATTPGSAKRRR